MAIEFKLPNLGEGITSADIASVLVKPGDAITAEQNVFEVETDKAVVELPCPQAGKIVQVHVKPGDKVKVGQLLLTIDGVAGATATAPASSPPASVKPAASAAPASAATKAANASPAAAVGAKPVATAQPAAHAAAPAPTGLPPIVKFTGSAEETQVAVIGAGPGGYPAAFACADHGQQVTLITDEAKPGGVCLHRGCIPSKALLHLAKLIHEAAESSHWGVSFAAPRIDLAGIRNYKNGVIEKLTGGITQLAKSRNVKVVQARATFADSKTLALAHPDGRTTYLRFQNAIIATGSTPAVPPIFRKNDPRVMDSTGALALEDIPARLLVVGGGYIGLEMGTVYAALGTKVTVVEMTAGLLPGADRDLVRPLQKRLETQFAAIRMNTKVEALDCRPEGVVATLIPEEGGPVQETFDRVLVSIGRRPTSQGLGLENTNVKVSDKGFIVVDKQRRSTEPHIFAVGDVAGEPMLAHKATREGKIVGEVIGGEPAAFDNVAIPAVVFTDPEIAWCGLTETQAKAEGRDVQVLRFPWSASGRAQAISRTEGLTKMLIEPKTQRVLGVGIVGAGAGEMIAEAVIAVETAAVARELADSIHAHPTLSETLMEAAEASLGAATHMLPPRARTSS